MNVSRPVKRIFEKHSTAIIFLSFFASMNLGWTYLQKLNAKAMGTEPMVHPAFTFFRYLKHKMNTKYEPAE